MRGRVRLGLVLIAAILIAASFLAVRRLERPHPSDPLGRLPVAGLQVAVASDDLRISLDQMEALVVHAALLRRVVASCGDSGSGSPAVDSRLAALGLYRWGCAWSDPQGAVFRSPEGGIPGPSPDVIGGLAPGAPTGSLRAVVAPPDLLARVRPRSTWEPLLPRRIEGWVTPSRDTGLERWTLHGGSHSCLLDLFLRDPVAPGVSRGWTALPPDASAIAWFALDPDVLGSPSRLPIPAAWKEWLEDSERFLGLPLQRSLAEALAGTGVAALVEPGEDGVPGALVVLDLARPEEARRVLDRVFALGVVSRAFRVHAYRGVIVGSRRSGAGAVGFEPAVAVDGNVLLIALRVGDLETAVDRRRSSSRNQVSAHLDGLPRGCWMAWTTSRFATRTWLRILGARSEVASFVPSARASLRFEDEAWILEGRGNLPPWCAEPVIPALRFALRGLRTEERDVRDPVSSSRP